jgi:uroporphyrinogen decarboxylase
MTPRERVLAAINHQTPDRVPIDLGGNQTGIHKLAYQALLKYLRIKDELRIMDAVQQLAQPCEAVLERFHVDTRYIAAGAAADFKGGIVKQRRGGRLWHDLTDEFGVTWSMPDDHPYYMDISHHPLANATVADIASYPFPKGDDPGRFVGLRERAQKLRTETPYAVVSGISGVVYETCWYLRGLEQWFMDLLTQPEFCEALLEQTLKFWLDWFRVFCAEVGDLVDVVMVGDDLTGQTGPLFRPDIYRAIVKPRQKQVVQYIHAHTAAKVWYHTCGACVPYIPDLLDNGVDILNPVQISAKDMEPAKLKAHFGGELAFWGGGIDAQHVLPTASPETVREHVAQNLAAWKPGGGYVFNNVHNIQAGVPPQNIVALFDAAYEFGFYDGR